MIQNIRITTLVENTASRAGLLAEHGLSFWIEYCDKWILFDTGQSNILTKNAKVLGIDLAETDAIVLSHGHYDHTGGLAAVLEIAEKAKIYLHPAAIEAKFSQKTSGAKSIGISDPTLKAIKNREVIWTETPTQIFPGVTVTGQVPRINDFENVGGAFFLDENYQKADELLDDQTLFIKTSKGLVIVFGCAHSGVVNTLDYISKLTGKKNIYAAIGGMHLLNANPVRIANTIETFKKYRVQNIIPLHCTGQKAIEVMKKAFGNKCVSSGTGGQINL